MDDQDKGFLTENFETVGERFDTLDQKLKAQDQSLEKLVTKEDLSKAMESLREMFEKGMSSLENKLPQE